jgi:hypothetical protein
MGAHPGDHLLLLALDGQLPTRRQARVAAHVASCQACQARAQELESTLADASRLYRVGEGAVPPASADARRRLERALLQAGDAWDRSGWIRCAQRLSVPPRGLGQAMAASLAALVIAWIAGAGQLPWSSASRVVAGNELPVAALTPGAVSSLTAAELCSGTHAPRMVTAEIRRRVLVDYGMEGTPVDSYELDALVTPELGGTMDPENLWPQRYAAPVWNAHVKDALEELFAERVCRDEMPLSQAQREMATDWVAAYKRHFNTDRPMPAHVRTARADDELVVELRVPVQSVAQLAFTGHPTRQ